MIRSAFATPARPQVHNGSAVARRVLGLRAQRATPSVEIFADILGRSVASDELVEEFLETDWTGVTAHLTLNHVTGTGAGSVNLDGLFPETAYFRDWLARGSSDYLVLMTGDGAYRFADVLAIIRLLEQQQSLGGVFGSRTQSRRQFITSVRAAYGENRLLYWLGQGGGVFSQRIVLSAHRRDFLRSADRASRVPAAGAMPAWRPSRAMRRCRSCASLIRDGVEVAELPVLYRTFSGFTDPNWRVRRGLHNLASLLP